MFFNQLNQLKQPLHNHLTSRDDSLPLSILNSRTHPTQESVQYHQSVMRSSALTTSKRVNIKVVHKFKYVIEHKLRTSHN